MSWRIPFKTFQRERFDPREAAPFQEWPADLALERIEAISVNARTTWFGLLGLLAFVLVTLLGVEDIDFFGYGRETDLPLIGVSVPTTTFFVAAPILTTAVYAYFHFYLLKLWDALGRAPARIGGDPLGDRIHPWLLSDAALLLREEEGAAPRRAMRYLSAITSASLTWVFGWTVLGIAWWRSLPAHYEWLSLLIAACFFIALWVGINSLVSAWRRVRLKAFDERSHIVWRRWTRWGPTAVIVAAGSAVTWNKTEGGLEGWLEPMAIRISDWRLGEEDRKAETDEELEARREAALPRWLTTRVLGSKDAPRAEFFRPFDTGWDDFVVRADLLEAHLTEKPADWLDRDTAEKAARRAWCDRRDMDWALCVKAPDDRQKALRNIWCEDAMKSPDLPASECGAFFVREETEFQNEWTARRDDYLSVLKKPNLERRDLRGAYLANAFLPDVDMEGARLEGANLSGARMEDVVLREARMEGAYLIGARMEGANLREARMEGANLGRAHLKSADLSGATFSASPLRSADFTNASGLTQNQLSDAIGNAETILAADAETGAQLFVWSCWQDAPENLLGLLETYPEFLRDDIRSDWLCAEDETPHKTGRTECGVEITDDNWGRPELLACPPDDPRRSREP